jgi:hypothetical protein
VETPEGHVLLLWVYLDGETVEYEMDAGDDDQMDDENDKSPVRGLFVFVRGQMTTLLSSLQSGSVILTLNRPERANAFNFEMTTALQNALAEAERDPQVKCVVITGSGQSLQRGAGYRRNEERRRRDLLP